MAAFPTAGDDTINGTSGPDTINALAGNDVVNGQSGDDDLDGGDNDDTINGDAGDDTLRVSGTGIENVNGGADTDTIVVNYSDATTNIFASFPGFGGGDYSGTIGDGATRQITYSGIEKYNITTGSGNDDVRVGAGADIVNLGSGNDFYLNMPGSPYDDQVDGGPGEDGLQYISFGITGIVFDLQANFYSGSSGSFTNFEYFTSAFTGSGSDVIVTTGANRDETIQTSVGTDSITVVNGHDTVDGGTQEDLLIVDYSGATMAVTMPAPPTPGTHAMDPNFPPSQATGFRGNFSDGATRQVTFDNIERFDIRTGSANDIIITGSGNDRLDGGLGADSMTGGGGNDIYVVDNVGDVVNENAGAGTDEIRTGLLSYSIGGNANLENLTGTNAAGQTLIGNGGNNVIAGAAGADLIDGGSGDDVMNGGGGNDSYVVDSAGDSIVELAGGGMDEVRTALASYTLATDLENLTGLGALGQSLTGNGGANVIDGGLGADTMTGLGGNDVYVIDDIGDVVVENGGGGTDEIRIGFASVDLAAYANVENLTGTSAAGQSLTGTGSVNVITGASGNDLIDGGAGADSMAGGAGNDIYIVADGGDLVTELSGEGTDEVRTALASYTLNANVENLTGLGNVDQTLIGNGGDNVIDGGLGGDHMVGGLGNDVYYIDNIIDSVTELAGEGTDEIRTSFSGWSLLGDDNIENLSATTNSNHDFRGNGGNNVVTGAGGNDFIRLQDGGVDTGIGAGGNDVFLFGSTLTSADSVDGGSGLDQVAIQGDYSGGLTLGAGFVSVESFAILPGSDTRFGDTAGNFYSYSLTTLNVNVAPDVLMIIDANRLRVGENFTFNGSAETDGNFFIYGGGGTDTLLGGSNNDTFYFGENLQFGATDHVDGGVSGTDQLGLRGNYTITFGAGQLTSIESIGMVSAQDTRFGALGSSYNYNLTMNDGNLAAGVRMTVDAAPLRPGETLTFDGGAELDGWFRIFGGQGSDTISGSQTADIISGGLGADSLRGNGGADTFLYRNVADSLTSAHDTILDFSSGDVISLSQIDAVSGSPANDAFNFIGSAAFSNTAGELRAVFDSGNNVWTVSGDVNGDGIADIEFFVSSDHPIAAGDFLL